MKKRTVSLDQFREMAQQAAVEKIPEVRRLIVRFEIWGGPDFKNERQEFYVCFYTRLKKKKEELSFSAGSVNSPEEAISMCIKQYDEFRNPVQPIEAITEI
jgi:hypothetical protein